MPYLHWKHLQVGAEVRVALTYSVPKSLIIFPRLVGASNLDKTNYSELTMSYSTVVIVGADVKLARSSPCYQLVCTDYSKPQRSAIFSVLEALILLSVLSIH